MTQTTATSTTNQTTPLTSPIEGASPAAVTLQWSQFKNARDPNPRPRSGTMSDLYRLLFERHVERASKDGPAWSPVSYAPNATRGNKNVVAIYALVADIDDGAPIEEARHRLQGFGYILHTSYSHTPEHPKYRVIVPLAQPVAPGEHASLWPRFNEMLGGHLDPATKDPARLYYLPAHPRNAAGFCSELVDGALLHPSGLPLAPMPEYTSDIVVSDVVPDGDLPDAHPKRKDKNKVEGKPPIFSRPGITEMYARCGFIKLVTQPEVQPHINEPLWRAMLSNHAPLEGGREKAHEGSKHHPKYTKEETDTKMEEIYVRLDGPHTCQYIRGLGSPPCPPKHNCLGPHDYVRHPSDLADWAGFRYMAPLPAIIQAREFVHRLGSTPLSYVNGEFLVYGAGFYRPISDAELRQAVQDHTGPTVKVKTLDEIVKSLATLCECSPATFARNRHLICCTNGTLDINTLELIPYSPDHFLRTGLPIAYDPGATCPRFLAFLHAVFRDDADKDERIAFLQQWMGYMLSPTVRLQLMVWLVGAGANGKSVLLELMRSLVGTENCSAVMLDRLSSGAVRAELDGKTLNVSSDLPRNAAINDGYMKACVAGDAIDGERKFKAPFTFRPTVKFVASMNNMPSTNDLSHGFFRRIVVLAFTRTFSPREQDQGLLDGLLEELPGILAWAVEGLRTLQQTWQIPIPPSSRLAVARYAAESNPVKLFAEEVIRPSEDTWLDSQELFQLFQLWCKANGFSPRSVVTFSREFGQLGFRKRKKSTQQWAVLLNGRFEEGDHGRVVYRQTFLDGQYFHVSEDEPLREFLLPENPERPTMMDAFASGLFKLSPDSDPET